MKVLRLQRRWGWISASGSIKSSLAISLPIVALILHFILDPFSQTSAKAWYQLPPTIYIGQPGTPVAVENFIKPDIGCNWSGIGGQVFNLQGDPVSGLVIKITGNLEGSPVLLLALTGGALQLGPGGYMIEFTDHPFESQGSLVLELLDIAGQPISSIIPLSTFANCEKNFLIFNLVEISTENNIYMPLILR
jgi:hypothetical protein